MAETKPGIKITQPGTISQNTPSVDLVTNGSVQGTSFQKLQAQAKRRLIVVVQGHEKTGKTHFALTAPGPIGIFDLDIGTEGVVEKFATDKEIHLAEYAVSFPYDQKVAEKTWQQFRNDYKVILGGSGVRTGIIDNAVEAFELLRIAKLGRLQQVMPHLYSGVNGEFRELLRMAYKSDTNLILIHKLRKQYVQEAWNGKYERAGFGDMGYLAQVIVETFREDDVFKLRVLDCRQNPMIKGLVIEKPTFMKLALAVYPDSTEDQWAV